MRKSFIFLLALAGLELNSQNPNPVCGGQTTTITPTSTLSGTSNFTLNPGGHQPANGVFVIQPPASTAYTMLVSNGASSYTYPVTVTVNPQPLVAPTFTQLGCNTTSNCFNFNLTFNPPTPVPAYTVAWGNGGMGPPNIPNGWSQPMSSLCGTISPGNYEALIVAAGSPTPLCGIIFTFAMLPAPAPATFSFIPAGPIFSVTCSQNTVNISASDPALNYTWNNNIAPTITNTEVALTFSDVSTWTVTAVNPTSSCSSTHTFILGQNTVVPVAQITPSFQNITCSNPIATTVSMTAVSPTVNFTHFIYTQQGAPFVANTQTAVFQPPAGTHTHCIVNNATGCSSCKEFTVSASNAGFPSFSLTSSVGDFTLGCLSKSCAVINIVNAVTQPTVGGAVSYTMLPPNGSTVLPITGNLSGISTYTLCTPGTWTAVVRDNSNACDNRVGFSMLQRTNGPPLDTVFAPRTILSCYFPTTTLTAFSAEPTTLYNWTFNQVPGTLAGPTIAVQANTAAPTSTVTDNFTITLTDPNNLCITRSIIPVYQNLFKPIVKISNGGTASLTCSTPTIMLSNQSSTGIPPNIGFPTNSLVVGWLWEGPTPQLPVQVKSTYVAYIQGDFTLTAMDYNNGCTNTGILKILENTQVPLVNPVLPNVTYPTFTLDCGADVTLTVNITTPTSNLTYSWSAPIGVPTSTIDKRTLLVEVPGVYSVVVTNTLNGCVAAATATAVSGTLTAEFTMDKPKGFAPHTVEFQNNSMSVNSTSINSVWSFGNDSVITLKYPLKDAKMVYTQPGWYKIMLYASKGTCQDIYIDSIEVDIPSHLKIPNVFTPNGDGVNDLYFLGTAALYEIDAKIIDRWGHTVYEVISEKGNIAWDGKNQVGKELPEGIYFFVIKARGLDGIDFDQQGYITLLR